MTNEQLAVLLQSFLTQLDEGMYTLQQVLPEDKDDTSAFAELQNLRDDLFEAINLLGGEQQ